MSHGPARDVRSPPPPLSHPGEGEHGSSLPSEFSGRVSDSGEGRWTVKAAIDEAVPAPVLPTALDARFSSRGAADFEDKLLSALRIPFIKITAGDGTLMELKPRPVDIEVTRPIGESYTGRDSQLDAAVRELLKQIEQR